MNSEPNQVNADRVCAIVEQRFEELDGIEMDLAIEAAGVAHAVDALRKALDLVEDRLKERKYESVANLRYMGAAKVLCPQTPREFAELHELGSHDEVAGRMRESAQRRLEEYAAACPDGIEVDPIISEGRPFLEILQKSHDFAVDAIVMSKIGQGGAVEQLLFGSTTEKVLRGTTKPVLVFPPGN